MSPWLDPTPWTRRLNRSRFLGVSGDTESTTPWGFAIAMRSITNPSGPIVSMSEMELHGTRQCAAPM